MTASNVFVTVPDPDRLIAGNHPNAPFVVSHIQLYRYTTEAIARADTDGSTGTLVTSFALIAASEAITDEDGPFRWGYYDSGALITSWYRYRFRDSGSTAYSQLSFPWLISQRPQTTLRELIFEAANSMGDSVKRGTATAGSTTTVTCTDVFKSTVVDARWHRGSYLWIEQTTDVLAPQGEERIIDSVATGTGIATVDNAYSVTPGAGDIFQVHTWAPPSEIIRCINRVRERMFVERHHKLALDRTSTGGNRYPLPGGVRQKSDVLDVRSVLINGTSGWQSVSQMSYEVEIDGNQSWLIFFTMPDTNVIDVVYEESYRNLEGLLTLPADVTQAPIEWLRRATAWEVYKWIYEGEDNVASRFGSRMGMTAEEVQNLSNRYGPTVTRRLSTGHREPIGPRRGAF